MSNSSENSSMLQMKNVHKYMDAKMQFLWWEHDDLVILCGPIILGILANAVFIGMAVSFVVGKLYSGLKDKHQEGYVRHFLYYHGFLKFKHCPESWVKEFTE